LVGNTVVEGDLKSPVPKELNVGNITCYLMCIYAATELDE